MNLLRYITLVRYSIFVSIAFFSGAQAWGQEEPAKAQESVAAAVEKTEEAKAEAVEAAESNEKEPAAYDLSPLPDDLRQKVELYIKDQEKLEKEIERLDSMVKASSNAWAQQRATGMATKLNYELKSMRLRRREIIRDYRELLRTGWTPPESMGNFESLFFASTGESSNS